MKESQISERGKKTVSKFKIYLGLKIIITMNLVLSLNKIEVISLGWVITIWERFYELCTFCKDTKWNSEKPGLLPMSHRKNT